MKLQSYILKSCRRVVRLLENVEFWMKKKLMLRVQQRQGLGSLQIVNSI